MGDEYVVDSCQLIERQFADTGPGVDQDVVVDQHRGGA